MTLGSRRGFLGRVSVSRIAEQIVLPAHIATEVLDHTEELTLASERQQRSFGGQTKGKFLLIFQDNLSGQAGEIDDLHLRKEPAEVSQAVFCAPNGQTGLAEGDEMPQIGKDKFAYFHESISSVPG
jgi:hypothetical protein